MRSRQHATRHENRQINVIAAIVELAPIGLLPGVLHHRLDSACMVKGSEIAIVTTERRRSLSSAPALAIRQP